VTTTGAGAVTPTRGGDPTPGGEPPARRRASRGPLVLVPLLLCFAVGFAGPVVLMIANAVRTYTRGEGFGEFTVAHVGRLLSDDRTLLAFRNTFVLAVVVVAICLVVAYPLGILFMSSSPRGRTVLLAVVLAPLLVNAVVRTFGWMILFAPGGTIDGLIGVRLYHTHTAVVIALVHLFFAYMILSLLTSLSSIPRDLVPAARTLGASPWFTFRRIILPLSLPGAVSGSIIVFGLSAGAVLTPLLLGGSTMPVVTIDLYRSMLVFFDPGVAATLASLLLAVNIAAILLGERAARRFTGYQYAPAEAAR
jgi:putative spermidine/putrescine transport system permease protein